jgi:Ala-tRNA(Pro) deacylase
MRMLTEFLDGRGARYVIASYSPGYSQREILSSPDLPGWLLLETRLVKIGARQALAVIRAGADLDLRRLAAGAGVEGAELASDEELARRFPGCELGAIPPFGLLFDLPLYVDESLASQRHVAFLGGHYGEVIKMRFEDYFRLAEPRLVALTNA